MVIVYYVFGPGNKVDRFMTFQNRLNMGHFLIYPPIHPSTTHPSMPPQPFISPSIHPPPTIHPSINLSTPTTHPSLQPSNLPVVHQLLVLSHFLTQLPFYCIIRCFTLLLHHHPFHCLFPLYFGSLSST
jgi:hypothetical protein